MLLQAVGAKDDPASHGRQMPSHWSSRKLNIVSQGSPTGTQCLHAIGVAEAGAALRAGRDDSRSRLEVPRRRSGLLFALGDGATSEGEFWESLNTASTRQLPVVYLVEDNGFAISVPVEAQTPGGAISSLVDRFPHLKVLRVDGCDFLASFARCRRPCSGHANAAVPRCVHASVVRPYSHSLSDDERLYKTAAERAAEAERDPVRRMREFLLAEGLAAESDLEQIPSEVDREIAEATDRALAAEKPPRSSAADWVFSPDVDPSSASFETPIEPQGKADTMVAAINRTLQDEMAHDPRIVVFGQDVADCSREDHLAEIPGKGGVFKVTHGLQRKFGGARVFNSPLAEANIVGRAFGMAVRGIKPVVEIQFFDYIWPAMMQIRDEITMLRYRSGNTYSCPMVIRTPIGGYLRGGAPYHSQSGRASSRTAPASAWCSRARRRTPPDCCARQSGATIRCSSSSTSTCIARPTTRVSTPDRTTWSRSGRARCGARAPTWS